jgi:TetR/AcrR family transcriptional regulator, transcriptional repressor for nem operon
MAGVKQFDQNEVLDRAMMLFWSQGYEATSIDQLVEATGINRGSLYGTFNDKNGIFLAVIDRYLETVAKSLMVTLSDPNPRQAIERMFDSIVGRLSDPKFPRGCLIVNTSLECPASGDAIARRIAQAIGQQESAIYRVLLRAQADSNLAAALDVKALARFFLGVAQALNVMNKAVADPEVLKDIVRIAMRIWDDGRAVARRPSRVHQRRKLH